MVYDPSMWYLVNVSFLLMYSDVEAGPVKGKRATPSFFIAGTDISPHTSMPRGWLRS